MTAFQAETKTWRVWPDRIFPSSPPPFARACAFTEYGLVHETIISPPGSLWIVLFISAALGTYYPNPVADTDVTDSNSSSLSDSVQYKLVAMTRSWAWRAIQQTKVHKLNG